MAKKLLAMLLAVSMVLSMCAFSIFAEETTDTENGEETATEPTEKEEPETEKDSIEIYVDNNYYPSDTVTVTGSVTGSITGVIVRIVCKEDGVSLEETVTVKKFESTGVSLALNKATVGAEYTVTVCDFANEDTVSEASFIIKKSSTSTSTTPSNSTGKVTIWIEGLTDRYIDKTTVSLKAVDDATVLGVARYVLDEEGRNYRLSADKSKIDRIATTATGSTYLRDGYGTSTSSSSAKYFADSEWSYFINGRASSTSMSDMEVEDGDEIIIYFGEPDTIIYPEIEIEPKNGISLGDKITVTVTDKATGDPIQGASVYFYKRNSTTKTGGKTDANGEYDDKTANSTFISTYQGGTVRVSYYQSSTKPPKAVSVEEDILIERDGSTAAYVTVEGAHKTLLSRVKSSKVYEYDLLNFAIEVFDAKGLDYELNSSKNNFEYIESKNTTGYSNENGDLTRNSGWYVCVNGAIYTPDDDLEDVDVYNDDEILFYFGDEDTIPVVYYKVDGDLKTDETVYVYFYSDEEMTEPLTRFYVYFTGDDISKALTTNSDGRVTLPNVEYKGTYELSWGEQVGVKDDYCPYAVYTAVKLTYTGTAKPTNNTSTTTPNTTTKPNTSNKEDDWTEIDDPDEFGVTNPDKNNDKNNDKNEENGTSEWKPGDYIPVYGDDDFVAGPSKYYPDTNIDSWAVDGINKAREYGLMSGTTYGYFEPLRGITRAEFTTIICRMLGLDTNPDSYEQKFTDVKPSDWCYGSVMAAQAAGYVSGKSATTFAPSDYITREEIAVLVARIIQAYGNEDDVYKYVDGTSVSAWARTSVVGVNATGIMTGDQYGQFLPKENVNRQTAAIIAVRLYEYLGLNR